MSFRADTPSSAMPPEGSGSVAVSAAGAADAALAATVTPDVPAAVDPGQRIERYTRGGDLTSVAALLTRWRGEILERWLAAVSAQPFHRARPDRAVADHIPQLFDGLVGLLMTRAPMGEDAAVLGAAREHARIRLEQGLVAPEVATEFRLLRQEIGRALRAHLDDETAVNDVMAAELVINDMLDGAVFLALSARELYDAERQRLAQLLEAEQRRLVVLQGEKDALLGVLAHDLKNPLTTIKGTVQLLQRRVAGGKLTPEHLNTQLETIHASVTRMTSQLDELLDVSRLAQGSLPTLSRRPADLVAIVREAVAAQQLATQAHRLTVETSESALIGEWDAPRLARVVDNLLSNAVKYSVTGGEILVSVSCEEVGGAGWAVLAVRDHGIGVPEADVARIFERLERAGNVADIPGAGIGLAASREIVELHGGSITVASALGQGSTFTVRLPREAGLAGAAGAN